jgi:hypothetical protein
MLNELRNVILIVIGAAVESKGNLQILNSKFEQNSLSQNRSRVSSVCGLVFRYRPRISDSDWTEFSVAPSSRCFTDSGNSSISNVVNSETKG